MSRAPAPGTVVVQRAGKLGGAQAACSGLVPPRAGGNNPRPSRTPGSSPARSADAVSGPGLHASAPEQIPQRFIRPAMLRDTLAALKQLRLAPVFGKPFHPRRKPTLSQLELAMHAN